MPASAPIRSDIRPGSDGAPRAPRLRLTPGSGVCECAGCGLVFKSVTGFDLHRVGPGEARRCLTTDELAAAGLTVNERGQWVTSAWRGEGGTTR